MRHELFVDRYVIYDDEGKEIFSVELTEEPNNQIIIKTPKEVFAGPIDFISFSENIFKKEY
jgi:hypothetical protein